MANLTPFIYLIDRQFLTKKKIPRIIKVKLYRIYMNLIAFDKLQLIILLMWIFWMALKSFVATSSTFLEVLKAKAVFASNNKRYLFVHFISQTFSSGHVTVYVSKHKRNHFCFNKLCDGSFICSACLSYQLVKMKRPFKSWLFFNFFIVHH